LVVFEILVRTEASDPRVGLARGFLAGIRRQGVGLALDDVGVATDDVVRPVQNDLPAAATRAAGRDVTRPARSSLVQEFPWDIPAVGGEPLQDGLVQPGIHGGGVGHLVCGAMEFHRKLLARLRAAVQIEELEQTMRRLEWDMKREEDAEKLKRGENTTRKLYTRFI
jgi:hypothetical protein